LKRKLDPFDGLPPFHPVPFKVLFVKNSKRIERKKKRPEKWQGVGIQLRALSTTLRPSFETK
jgi:hypothetical protein